MEIHDHKTIKSEKSNRLISKYLNVFALNVIICFLLFFSAHTKFKVDSIGWFTAKTLRSLLAFSMVKVAILLHACFLCRKPESRKSVSAEAIRSTMKARMFFLLLDRRLDYEKKPPAKASAETQQVWSDQNLHVPFLFTDDLRGLIPERRNFH